MAVHCYECLFLFDSNKYARDAAGVVGQITKLLERVGAETLVSRLWTEQKLAYPINNQRKGAYWLTLFKMPADKLDLFHHECRLNESLLRYLCIKIDARIVDVMVEHARTGHAPAAGPLGERPMDREPAAAAVAIAVPEGIDEL